MQSSDFWTRAFAALTAQWPILFATVLSPVIAVLVTILYQKRDQNYRTKYAIFVELMKQRRKGLDVNFVDALNLVPVVFWNHEKISNAFREVMDVYSSADWKAPLDQEWGRDKRMRLNEELNQKTALMLSYMAKELRVEVDQLTILQGAYLPEAWAVKDRIDQEIKEGLRDVLTNQRLLPILAHVRPVPDSEEEAEASPNQTMNGSAEFSSGNSAKPVRPEASQPKSKL